MASVYQRRGAKTWTITYTGADGKQVREAGGWDGHTAKTKQEAEAKLALRIREVADGIWVDPAKRKLTVNDLLDSYEAHRDLKGMKSSVASALKRVRATLGERQATSIRPEDIEAHIVKYRGKPFGKCGKPLKDAAVNRGLQALNAAFTLARKQNRIVRTPHIPQLKEDNTREGFFTRAEFEALLPHLSVIDGHIARFGYLSGWRLGNVTGLEWSRVDRVHGEITCLGSETKNGHPLILPVDEDLTALLDEREALDHAEGRISGGLVFHRDGNRVRKLRSWHDACAKAGVTGRLFHDFRRTVVSDQSRAGVPQAVTMKQTGHKTTSMYRRYNIVLVEDLKDAAARMKQYRAAQPAKSNVVGIAGTR